MLERSLTTKRYAVPAFSFVTFLPCMVSPIVKPGPTVPLTVFAEAAKPLPVAASAVAATTLSSKDRVRVILFIPFASFGVAEAGSSKAGTVLRTVQTPLTFNAGSSRVAAKSRAIAHPLLRRDVVVEVEDVLRVVSPLDLSQPVVVR